MGLFSSVGRLFGVRSEEKAEKSAGKKRDRGFILARQQIEPAYGQTRKIIKRTSRRLGDITRTGSAALQSINTGGFNRARGEIQSGAADQRQAIVGGFQGARQALDSPELVEARRLQYERAAGRGGFDQATLERLKANAREEFGTAGREVLRTASGFSGNAAAPGLRSERVGYALSDLGRQRASAIRDIDIQNERLRREEQAGALQFLTEDAVRKGNLSIDEGTALSSLSEKTQGALAGFSVDEAIRSGQIKGDEIQMLLSIEDALGQSLADMTMDQAMTIANLILSQHGAAAESRIRLGQAKSSRYQALGELGDEGVDTGVRVASALATGGGSETLRGFQGFA